jgi:hypothetical protein
VVVAETGADAAAVAAATAGKAATPLPSYFLIGISPCLLCLSCAQIAALIACM